MDFIHQKTCCQGIEKSEFLLRTGKAMLNCADYLAKLAAKGSNALIIWDSPPPGMNHLLQADLMGLCFS
jgi:hypothetical protein